jgi:exopolysaccharide biosynthesis polyprenyl glycosylphosphotransferase
VIPPSASGIDPLHVGHGRGRQLRFSAPGRWRLYLAMWLALTDLAVLVGWAWATGPEQVWSLGPTATVFGGLAVFGPVLVFGYISGSYRSDTIIRGSLPTMVAALALAWIVAWLVAKTLETKLGWRSFSTPHAKWAVSGVVVAALATWATRAAMRALLRRHERRTLVVLLGEADACLRLATDMRARGRRDPIAVLTTGGGPGGPWPERVEPCGPLGLLHRLRGRVLCVVTTGSWEALPRGLQRLLVRARLMNVPVLRPVDFSEMLWGRSPVHGADASWITGLERLHHQEDPFFVGTKRLLDLALAGTGLVLAAGPMLLIALAVRLTSAGPVFYLQRRTGQWEREFTICKFRTMRADAEKDGARWASQDDDRTTPLGRLLRRSRLDELPQLWNILLGDMSLVGPRPERPEFNARLEREIPFYNLRHLAKPGLTGWAQINHPYGASVDDARAKLEFDVWYVKNSTVLLDLLIILRTVMVVVGLRGR